MAVKIAKTDCYIVSRLSEIKTDEDRLAILDKAHKLLDGGRRWIQKGFWLTQPVFRKRGKGTTRAECYCIAGAVETAAWKLGYTTARIAGEGIVECTSLYSVIRTRTPKGSNIYDFNDAQGRTWADVDEVFQTRMSQLRESIKG